MVKFPIFRRASCAFRRWSEGQLALHPAAAQFLLDNAQNAQRTGGDERGWWQRERGRVEQGENGDHMVIITLR